MEPVSAVIVPRGNLAPHPQFETATKEEKMTDERFEWISRRAYAIWEAAGRPWGCSQHHWEQAAKEREIMERTRASTDGEEILARFRPKAAETPRSEDDARDTEKNQVPDGRRVG